MLKTLYNEVIDIVIDNDDDDGISIEFGKPTKSFILNSRDAVSFAQAILTKVAEVEDELNNRILIDINLPDFFVDYLVS